MPDRVGLSGDRDQARLRRVCGHFLYATRWVGELGDPVPRTHRARVDRRNVTEMRHERRVCHEVIGEHKDA